MQFTPITDDKVQIYLLFYRPACDDPFQNRLVAFFNGPFCHVEMAFPEKYGIEPWEKEVWGTSIYQGDTIFYKTKTYQREGYFSFAIEVTKSQCLKIKNYCRMQADKGVKFSQLAMYSAYLPFQVFKDIDGTFCSKHVTMALQEGGIGEIMHLNPCLVTPSSLYRVLLMNSAQSPIVQVVPSKMMDACNMSSSVSSSSSNTICSKMAKEMLDVFKNEAVLNQSSLSPEQVKTSNIMSRSFMENYLLNPSQNKKLTLFY
jgi:hypothetical protein